jgi:hypothetical protein
MKLIFDCRFIRVDHHDGISRFSAELFSAVSKKVSLVALISSKAQLKWLPEGTVFRIHEYDGNESIEIKEDMDWQIA